MSQRVIDIRSRPAFLHDFYGARRDTPEFETAKWLNRRVGSLDDEHFVRSQSLDGYLNEVRAAGVTQSVVIGRDTPAIRNDNDQIAELTSANPELIGVGSVDPQRLGVEGAADEAKRAITDIGLRAINVEPAFGAEPVHFDDAIYLAVYETLQQLGVPVFFMSGPTIPNLAFNDPAAVGRVARAFPGLSIVVHHGMWPRANEIIGVAFRYPNVFIVPDMYIFLPGGKLYVEAANGFLRDQLIFGSSYPFRPIRQSIDDYLTLGFAADVIDAVMYENARRLLRVAVRNTSK